MLESQLKKVGVSVEPIYQAKKYRGGDYKDQIKLALNKRIEIRDILNVHSTTPYGDEYYQISVYCEKYKTDETTIAGWDGESIITYKNNNHDYEGKIDLNSTSLVKLPWRVDWLMRCVFEKVDFAVSFDLDVLKTYEDYGRQERLAYGLKQGNEKKVNMAKRVIELSQVGEQPRECPYHPSFRHLCNVLQINDGNIEKARASYSEH